MADRQMLQLTFVLQLETHLILVLGLMWLLLFSVMMYQR